MAFDSNSKSNYLIKFDWTTKKADIYPIKGFDSDPNNQLGTSFGDALIYAEDSTGDYPVKGYIVGGTKAIWTYNDKCDEPDFGVTINQYQQLVSPASYTYGFVDRLELNETSCRNEDVKAVIKVDLTKG